MADHSTLRSSRAAIRRPHGNHTLRRAVLVALSTLTGATVAHAESAAAPSTLEEVVVTGLRHSLDSAAEIKQQIDSISESVVAEDIGKLPDVSVAEALARLPGVAAQRVDGRAQDLSIRGMGPQFSLTLLNGNEMASTGLNRSFQYDQIPAELVSQVTVYKTSDVSLGSQGLAGTVDIQTIKPLSVNGTKFAASARAEHDSQGSLVPGIDSKGNRFSLSYIDQFADHTVGLALGFSHLDSPILKKYLNPWDYGHVVSDFGISTLPPAQAAQDPYGWDGFENGVAATSSKRDAGIAVLEFKPNENFHSTLTYLQSRFDEKMRGAELVGEMANWGIVTPEPGMSFTAPNSVVRTNDYMLDTLRGDNRLDSIHSVDWATEAKFGDWTAKFDASYSKATRDEIIGEAYVTNTNPMDYTFTYTGMGGFSQVVPGIDLSSPANMNLSSYWGSAGYQEFVNTDDKSRSARFALSRDLGDGLFRKVDFGVIYSDRSKVEGVVSQALNFAQGAACNFGTCAPATSNLGLTPVSLGFSGAGNLLYFDVLNAIANSGAYVAAPEDSKRTYYNWTVDEKLTTGFVKLGLGFDAGIPWRGNVGVQVIHTNQTSTGLYTDANGNQLRNNTGGASYTDALPSLMLIGDLTAHTKLRIGVARSESRPQMGDMTAGISASIGTTNTSSGPKLLWSGSGGNPALHPWKSTDFDLDLEHYFTRSTYVALAAFDKQIGTAIRQGVTFYDFTGFVDPTGKVAASNIGSLTAPVNQSGGYVRGIELSGQVAFGDYFPSLGGFGFLGNVAYSESDLPGLNVDGTINPAITFDGLSKIVAGGALFYEKGGWQVRVAERYRSGYSAFRLNAFKFVIDQIEPELILDAQIGYTLQSGPLKNLEIQLQGENLTDRPYVVSQLSYGQSVLSQYHTFGRQVLFGVNYKF